jgi:hypothetical protein
MLAYVTNSSLFGGIDFNILVLSAGSWPLTAPTTAFNIPEDVSRKVYQGGASPILLISNLIAFFAGGQNLRSIPEVLSKQAFRSQAKLVVPAFEGGTEGYLFQGIENRLHVTGNSYAHIHLDHRIVSDEILIWPL